MSDDAAQKFKKLGVIGHPIDHSKSPLIHNYWIKKYELSAEYEAIDIAPENFAEGLNLLIEDEGYEGFNLTLPHKNMALSLCDDVDDVAKAVGAVNTIAVRDGKLYGMNTDVFGFMQNLKKQAPDYSFSGSAVILGAGGAAKACIYGLLQEGVPKIHLLNRTREKADELAQMDDRIKVYDWDARDDVLAECDLLVNTTSLGMKKQDQLDIDLFALPQEAVVYDIVYVPLYTDLLCDADARGNKVVTGLGMLLQQARPAFEAWFGILPEIDKKLEKEILPEVGTA